MDTHTGRRLLVFNQTHLFACWSRPVLGAQAERAGSFDADMRAAPSPCRSFNMIEAARVVGIKRFFYASSACIYPGARRCPCVACAGCANVRPAAVGFVRGQRQWGHAALTSPPPTAEYKQLDVEVEGGGLKEADAWPAQPQVGPHPAAAWSSALVLCAALKCCCLTP